MPTAELGDRQALLFSDAHRDFEESVRSFASQHAKDYLEQSKSTEFPWELNASLGAQGLLGLGVSDRFGGQTGDGPGVERVFAGIAVEELAYANVYASILMSSSAVNGHLLESHLQPDLLETWLPPLTRGETYVCFGLTEPAAGSDAGAITTEATKVDGGWRLRGEKTGVTAAPHATAILVIATTDRERKGRAATAFLVPRDSEGLGFQVFADAAWKPIGRGGIGFDDVFVPDSHLVGPVEGAFKEVMRGFDFARPMIGLTCVGAARRAIEMTIEYSKERQAFGRPISTFQAVAFPLAEHLTRIEAVRALCYRALALGDAGQPYTREASMVKWWAPRVAVDAIRDCIVGSGHSAYTEELPLQAMLRDIAAFDMAEGTPQIQKMILARSLFGREFAPH